MNGRDAQEENSGLAQDSDEDRVVEALLNKK